MSRSAILRRSAVAAALVFVVIGFSAATSGLPAKLFGRATGAEHALLLYRSPTGSPRLAVDSTDLVLTPVPEPGVIASLIGGVAILLGLRRRSG